MDIGLTCTGDWVGVQLSPKLDRALYWSACGGATPASPAIILTGGESIMRTMRARAMVIPVGGAAAANWLPSLRLPISVVPNTISATASASSRFLLLASLPTLCSVVSHCKSCSLEGAVHEGI